MTITEKAAYVKGLAEGLKIADDDNGKILKAIIDLLEDICDDVTCNGDDIAEICDQLDEVDEDLANLEDYVYDEDGCGCGCGCDCDCDCDCGCQDDDDDLFEVECPKCHDKIYLDYEMLEEGGIECPNCGETLEFDIPECDCEECKDSTEE